MWISIFPISHLEIQNTQSVESRSIHFPTYLILHILAKQVQLEFVISYIQPTIDNQWYSQLGWTIDNDVSFSTEWERDHVQRLKTKKQTIHGDYKWHKSVHISSIFMRHEHDLIYTMSKLSVCHENQDDLQLQETGSIPSQEREWAASHELNEREVALQDGWNPYINLVPVSCNFPRNRSSIWVSL